MKNGRRLFAAIASIAFSSLGILVCHAQTDTETHAASVLFKQFETVAYTRTDFLPSLDKDDPNENDGLSDMRFPFLGLLGGLKSLGPNTIRDFKKSYSAVLVGAKDFVGPSGLGMVSSRMCYIGILRGSEQPVIESDFRQTAKESIDGRQVWTMSMPPYEGHPQQTEFYAAQIGSSYFVLTNDRQVFLEATRSLTSAESSTPQSITVSGWETFSTHKYWAYRLFRRSGVINLDAAGMKYLTPDVISLSFFADVDKGESFIQVLSSDTSMKTIPRILPESALNPPQPQGAGIWQTAIPLSNVDTGTYPLFRVFYCFGFGLAL
jgi:hypothetical protein